MKWVRENMFLVVLLGVVVIGGGALLGLQFTIDVDEPISVRETVSQDVSSLYKAKPVNADVLNQVQQYREQAAKAATDGIQGCVNWNRVNLPVFQIRLADGTLMDAWPYDPVRYEREGGVYNYTGQYVEQLHKMLAKVQPVVVNEQEMQREIANEIEQRARRRQQEIEADERRRNAESGGAPAPVMPSRPMGEDWNVGSIRRPLTGGVTNINADPETIQAATLFVKSQKSQSGSIYAGIDSLDVFFPKADTHVSPDKLWYAQVNLWVQSEILGAIADANRRVVPPAEVRRVTVPNAAVKQLVRIAVEEQCYMGGGAASSTSDYGSSYGAPAAGSAPTLTQRVSNQKYDIIQYEFTVVMPHRYLPLLQQCLLERNYHTILNMNISAAYEPPNALQYYGTDAIVQATIQGELMLLTDWVRPLMPVEVLRTMESALRQEDRERVMQAGGFMAPVSTPSGPGMYIPREDGPTPARRPGGGFEF